MGNEDIEIKIEHSPDHNCPGYFTQEGVFEKRHVVTTRPGWAFIDPGEWPTFALVCSGEKTVSPNMVERLHKQPSGLCDSSRNSVHLSFLRGPSGDLCSTEEGVH